MPCEKNWFPGFRLVKTISEKILREKAKSLLHQPSLMKSGGAYVEADWQMPLE